LRMTFFSIERTFLRIYK